MPAIAPDHDEAQPRHVLERLRRAQQALDETAIVSVVHFGPVEHDARDAALVEAPQDRTCRIRKAHAARLRNSLSEICFIQGTASIAGRIVRSPQTTKGGTRPPLTTFKPSAMDSVADALA